MLQGLFLTLLILKEIKTISLALKSSVVLGAVPNGGLEGSLRVTVSRGSHIPTELAESVFHGRGRHAQMSQTEANISKPLNVTH